MDDPAADRALTEAMADEMLRHAPLALTLRPESVFQLVALLQLACRHPLLSPSTRAFAREFIDHAHQYFADCPAVLAVLERGDDPAHDRHS